jgi:tripartite-type tricarboxylate transporter receptor subunit TctC
VGKIDFQIKENIGWLITSRILVLTIFLGTTFACTQQSVDGFYENRSITILVGSGPGGVTDTSARIIAGFLEDHIPGRPTVIVQNMPGGGGVTMANHVYRSSARDGTVLGYSLPGVILAQLMEPGRAKYDGRELGWIGSAITVTNMIAVLSDSPVKTLEDTRHTEIIIGATGRGSPLYQLPAIAKELLDLQIRIITGYQGSSEITLAMERGEVDGQAAALDYWSLSRPEWLTNGQLTYLAYIGPADERAPNAPHLGELVSSDQEKELITFLETGSNMGWPLFAPPGIPAARLTVLRNAFSEMLQTEEFAEAVWTSMRTPVNPTQGEALQTTVEMALETPESVIAEVKELLGI